MSNGSQNTLNRLKNQPQPQLLPSAIPKSKVLGFSNWSSNISVRKNFNDDNNSFFDPNDTMKLTKQMSDECYDNTYTKTTNRPSTSVSLPSKVKEEEKAQYQLGDRAKNPSCPVIVPTPAISSQTLSIKVKSITSDATQTSSVSTNECVANSDLNPISIVLSSPTTNSNLEYFINLASNPFTTKFEVIGSEKATDSKRFFSHESSKLPVKSSSTLNLNTKQADTSGPNETNSNDDFYCKHFKPIRSISDENLNEEYKHPAVIKSTREKTNFIQLTDKVFTGQISCLRNERKMCKLNIEYLIDMTGMRPDQLNSKQSLGKIPCPCKLMHSRTTLAVELADKSFKNLFIAFSEVNKLIHSAKMSPKNKCVLIFGRDCLSSAVVYACAQYLMVDYQMDMKTSLSTILGREYKPSDSSFDPDLASYLGQLETYLKHLAANIQFNYLPGKNANKANKFAYNTLKNEDEKSVNKEFHFDSIYKSSLDYCNISDEDNDYRDAQYKNRNKYIAKHNSTELLTNPSRSNKLSALAFNQLKKAENSTNGSARNESLKMAWM